MPGEVHYIPAGSFLYNFGQQIAGRAVLQQAQLYSPPPRLHKLAHQLLEAVTLLAQVERSFILRKAEDAKHTQWFRLTALF
jgi:hypothetical protein